MHCDLNSLFCYYVMICIWMNDGQKGYHWSKIIIPLSFQYLGFINQMLIQKLNLRNLDAGVNSIAFPSETGSFVVIISQTCPMLHQLRSCYTPPPSPPPLCHQPWCP